jgi:uroporphyrinogen III methyltransferase/synthase
MTRLLVTRPSRQAEPLARALRDDGLETTCVPTVAIAAATDGSLDAALARTADFDWLVVTSANGVTPLIGRIPASVRVAAVGPATAAALASAGIRVDHVPNDYLSAAVAAGMGDLHGRRVLLARADAATPQLHEALVGAGALVSEAVAYRTIEGPPESRDPLRRALHDRLDGIVFSSASAVRGLLALLDDGERARAKRIPALCIGPVTAAQARADGFMVDVVAGEHTGIGLSRAIAAHFATEAA